MKTELLKEIGLTQEQIDRVMAENGKDVNAVRGNLEQLNAELSEIKNQLSERDNQLKELKKTAKDNEGLTLKLTELEEANKKMADETQTKIEGIQKAHLIENGVRDAKAKNVKAVMALLDMDKIVYKDGGLSGLTEQLEALQKGEDSGFMFGEAKPTAPAGTTPKTPPNGGSTYTQMGGLSEALSKALGK